MKQERTHHNGHFGVFFTVTRFTVMPEDRLALRSLHFCGVGGEHWKVHDFITDTYDRMLAQKHPCEMVVEVSNPLTREQAELFNMQNAALGTVATKAARSATRSLHPYLSAFAIGAVGLTAFFTLEASHAGDIVVAVQARVNGGIGPQSTSAAMLIKARGGVP